MLAKIPAAIVTFIQKATVVFTKNGFKQLDVRDVEGVKTWTLREKMKYDVYTFEDESECGLALTNVSLHPIISRAECILQTCFTFNFSSILLTSNFVLVNIK